MIPYESFDHKSHFSLLKVANFLKAFWFIDKVLLFASVFSLFSIWNRFAQVIDWMELKIYLAESSDSILLAQSLHSPSEQHLVGSILAFGISKALIQFSQLHDMKPIDRIFDGNSLKQLIFMYVNSVHACNCLVPNVRFANRKEKLRAPCYLESWPLRCFFVSNFSFVIRLENAFGKR